MYREVYNPITGKTYWVIDEVIGQGPSGGQSGGTVTGGDAHDHVGGDGAPIVGIVTGGDAHDHVGGDGAAIAGIVTGGDAHDHSGGDGAQIAYSTLSGLPALGSIADNAEADFAVAAKGVTNGDSHDHAGGDGAQIAYSGLSGLPTLGSIADNAEADFAVAAKGVTNGDSHNHAGGDGAQIAYSGLSGLPTLGSIADNAESDFAVAAKGVTNGDTHDHAGGDGAQIDHGGLGGLSDNDHTQYAPKASPTFTGTVTVDGGQIAFPATQAPSAGANTLDDYEENTWTPAMAGSLGTLSYAYQLGRYTKIGRMVVAYAVLNFTKGTASGTATMSGLPFTPESTYSPIIFWISGYTPTILSGHTDGGTGLQLFNDNGGTYVTYADFAASTTMRLCITYFV